MLSALWGVMFLNLGFPAYGPAVINAAMAKAVGLNREALGDMFSVYMIMSGLPGPLVAMSVNHFGVRKTLVLGSSLIIAGSLLMATVVTGALGAMLCFGLLVGAGVATGAALASQAGLARWFVRRRSLALSVLYSAGAIGGFVAAPLLNRLIEASGTWRVGWWLLGTLGAWAVGVMTVSGLIGKLILATLGDRIDPRYIFALFMAVFAVGLVVIVDARAFWQVILFAICLGIGFGGGLVCLMSVLSNYFGTRAFASLAGLAVAINTTLSAIAPKVAGRLFDQGVGYGATFYFLAAWCFVGAVALCFTRRPGTEMPIGTGSNQYGALR